jgi:hypothetical protein
MCKYKCFVQVSYNLKFQEEILLSPKTRNFSKFSFQIHFESGEEKVASFFKTFSTIFYFKFLSSRMSCLDQLKFEGI